jgi:disulfide bond formation protein DsbB
MLDRTTNLLVLLIVVLALAALGFGFRHAWGETPIWEQQWVAKAGVQPSIPADQLLTALKNATAAEAYDHVATLENALRKDFEPIGASFLHILSNNLFAMGKVAGVVFLFLVVPVSLNYVRHGKFRLWNRDASA